MHASLFSLTFFESGIAYTIMESYDIGSYQARRILADVPKTITYIYTLTTPPRPPPHFKVISCPYEERGLIYHGLARKSGPSRFKTVNPSLGILC